MEVNFKRTFVARNRRYALGEIGAMHGYALEITELRPRLSAGKLQPGEAMLILFGVTPEEYQWQENDPKRLDQLAAAICKTYPADRLIGYLVRDLKGNVVARDVRLETVPTIDENGFSRPPVPAVQGGAIDVELSACARLQKIPADAPEGVKQDWIAARAAAAQALLKLDAFYVAYDALLNGRYPAQGFDGRIELFTSAERAENAHRQIAQAGGVDIWQIREIQRDAYDRFLADARRMGMELIRVDNGYAAAELRIDDFGNEKPASDARMINLMLREVAYAQRWNRLRQAGAPEKNIRGALESTLTMQNFARREIGNAILYIACPGAGGRECTQAARARIGEGRIVLANDYIQITDNRDGRKFVPAFTSHARVAMFAEKMNPPVHPVAATFDDVIRLAKDCDGVALNIDDIGYRILRDDFDKVLELRAKPPIAVRVQTEAEAEAENASGAPAAPRMSASLPDPDAALPNPDTALPNPDADAPERNADAPKAAETAPALEQPLKKTGFFKRLFGK